ncbi:SpaA isopeptide-forming pilin-related protein [Bifidobacterium cebidarum]|uniref:SpaA-like prealbumin fold domain-containing protein n=1 Tax=Bifidobacterium cebidarum TaxID=2650773 RepID=A0A6I1GHG8_9BIFI|nr:SpaA isopeptide-forming pilin-related protein [Bifidobacterium cebidarum]KAB7788829.1 hypothetical protein F7D08_0563 [Bifidobacterium cebidarum]
MRKNDRKRVGGGVFSKLTHRVIAGLVAGAMLFVGVPVASAVEAVPQSDDSTKNESALLDSALQKLSDPASGGELTDAERESLNSESIQSYQQRLLSNVPTTAATGSCSPDQWSWNQANLSDSNVATYVGRTLWVGVPDGKKNPAHADDFRYDGTSAVSGGGTYPNNPGWTVEFEGRTVVGWDVRGHLNRNMSLSGAAWGAGFPAHGDTLGVLGSVGALRGSTARDPGVFTSDKSRIGNQILNLPGTNQTSLVSVNGSTQGLKDDALRLTDEKGVTTDYNGYADKIRALSDSFDATKPTAGVVFDNVNFGSTSEATLAPAEDMWFPGNDAPLPGAENGHPDSGNGKELVEGYWKRVIRVRMNSEGMVTFTGDGGEDGTQNTDHTLQVFTLNMNAVNAAYEKNHWTGISYSFKNIPQGAKVLVNVVNKDENGNSISSDINFHTGWRLWWNGTQVAHQYRADNTTQNKLVTASSSIMWNFSSVDKDHKLVIANDDSWQTLPDAAKPSKDGITTQHADAEAGVIGSVLAANAGRTELWTSSNGKFLVGGDLWVSQDYDGWTKYGVGMSIERHNFPWMGNASISCPTTGTVEWSKVDKDSTSKVLSGSEWKIVSLDGSGVNKTVVDNGENDADTRPGYLQVTGLPVNKDLYLQETKAPDGYDLGLAPTYKFQVDGNGVTKLTTNGVTDGKVKNTAYQGKAAWYKVDAADDQKLLAGSEWLLTCSSGDCTSLEENNIPWSRKIVDKVSKDDDRNEAQWDWSEVPGYIVIQNLPLNSSYTLEETKAPDGYQLNTSTYTLNVTDPYSYAYPTLQGQEVQRILNEKRVGSVTWYKGESGLLIDGSEWKVTGPCKSVGCTASADSSASTVKVVDDGENDSSDTPGELKLTGLDFGNYTIVETKAPEGHIIDTTPHNFSIMDQDGQRDYEFGYIFNNQSGMEISWRKVDEDDANKLLAGSVWTLSCVSSTGLSAADQSQYCNPTEREIADNGPYDTKPDDDGVIATMIPQYSSMTSAYSIQYKLVEKTAPKGYVTNPNDYWTFTISKKAGWQSLTHYTWADKDGNLLTPSNNTNAQLAPDIKNRQQPGQLLWYKADGSQGNTGSNRLTGSEWNLRAVKPVKGSGTDWSACSYGDVGCDIAAGSSVLVPNMPDGTFMTKKDLKPGDYVLTETKAPEGYYLPSPHPSYYVTVKPGGTAYVNANGRVDNYEPVQPKWKKMNSTTPGKYLPGSEWRLTNTADIYDTITVADNDGSTDLDGAVGYLQVQINPKRRATEKEPIQYTLVETKAPSGYILDKTEYTLSVWYDATKTNWWDQTHWFWTWKTPPTASGVALLVKNSPYLLPLTGGVGTARGMLAIGGGLALFIVVAGAIWHEWRKRKEELLL